jgi:hypothetical protein
MPVEKRIPHPFYVIIADKPEKSKTKEGGSGSFVSKKLEKRRKIVLDKDRPSVIDYGKPLKKRKYIMWNRTESRRLVQGGRKA